MAARHMSDPFPPIKPVRTGLLIGNATTPRSPSRVTRSPLFMVRHLLPARAAIKPKMRPRDATTQRNCQGADYPYGLIDIIHDYSFRSQRDDAMP